MITGSVRRWGPVKLSPAGVIEVDFKTREVTLEHPRKGPLGGSIAANALGATINTWHDARNLKASLELHRQAEPLVVCSVDAASKAAAPR